MPFFPSFFCVLGESPIGKEKCEIFVKNFNLFHPYHFLIKTMTVFIEHLLIKNFQENSLIFLYSIKGGPHYMGKGPFHPKSEKIPPIRIGLYQKFPLNNDYKCNL